MSVKGYFIPEGVNCERRKLLFSNRYGEIDVEVPCVDKEVAEKCIEKILLAREDHLLRTPLKKIIQAIDKASSNLSKRNYSLRKEAEEILPIVTGFSHEMISANLDSLMDSFRMDKLYKMLQSELGNPDYLDGFAKSISGKSKVFGPRLSVYILSGNVLGPKVISVVYSLIVKSAAFFKSPYEEPVFTSLFIRAISDVDYRLAEVLASVPWEGGKTEYEEVEDFIFGKRTERDIMVLYGDQKTWEEIRNKVNPVTKFVHYPPRMGFCVIGRENLTKDKAEEIAERAALDICMSDQLLCSSPQFIYIENGGEVSPEGFAISLKKKVSEVGKAIPRGEIPSVAAARINELLRTYKLQEILGSAQLFESLDGIVIYDMISKMPELSCLYRIVRVKPIDDISEIPDLMEPFSNYLQTVGVELSEKRKYELCNELGSQGASRITSIGKMHKPSLTWHHDGRFNILDLLNWVDIET
jgi:hypothetical protein